MRIAILIRELSQPGGAERSMFTLKEYLTENHTVKMFGQCGSKPTRGHSLNATRKIHRVVPHEMEMSISYATTLFAGLRSLQSYDPDIVITQHQSSIIGAMLNWAEQIPHVMFLRDFEPLPSEEYDQNLLTRWTNETFSHINKQIFSFIHSHAELTIANSEFTARQYKKIMGMNPSIIYPFVADQPDCNQSQGDKIIHVTPTRAKGIDITIKIADCMSNEEFIIVGTAPPGEIQSRITEISNIEYIGYVEDMSRVYRRGKLVLMPSKWNEPFGRVPIEAGLHGVPTITSANGGLPESVGVSRFVVESNTVEDYVDRIRTIEQDYERSKRAARQNAHSKTAGAQVELLKSTVRQEIGFNI